MSQGFSCGRFWGLSFLSENSLKDFLTFFLSVEGGGHFCVPHHFFPYFEPMGLVWTEIVNFSNP